MSNFVAGGYAATWNSLAVGQCADGFRLSHSFFKRLVTGDAMAEAPQDAVYRGAEMFLQMVLIEFNAAAIYSIMWPYGSYLDPGTVGRMDVKSALAKTLTMTAIAGTPAASSPASLTLELTILAEGFPVELLFAPNLREIPIRLRAYPDDTLSSRFGYKS
jgi:hypothetical protein